MAIWELKESTGDSHLGLKSRKSHREWVQCNSLTSRDQCGASLNPCSECQWSAVDQYHTLKSRRKDREAEKKSLNKNETLVCDALDANGKSGRTIPFSGLQQLSHKLSSCNVHIFVWKCQGRQISAHHTAMYACHAFNSLVYVHTRKAQLPLSWFCDYCKRHTHIWYICTHHQTYVPPYPERHCSEWINYLGRLDDRY